MLFCDIYGNLCFEKSMNNVTVEDTCKCPIECDSITYSFSLVSTPFNPEELCPRKLPKDPNKDFLMKEFYLNKNPPQFVRKLIEFKDNISSYPFDYCKTDIQYRAEVIFRMATDSIEQVKSGTKYF